jgi:hypothetical protein
MSSMSASHNLIVGGTFTNHNDTHYHGFRGAYSSLKMVLYETQGFLKSVESSNILHRATATAAFHNSDERFDPPKCHPNTRSAVLTKIMKWIKREEDLDAFIMWMYGPAGAGKSAIAQTIAEMCDEEILLLASFFFSRNDPSRIIVKPLIATIAYQIILNLFDARDAILGAIECDPLIFSKSLAVQVKSLIVAPLQQLAEAGLFDESTSRRLVIIDGLDECFDHKVQQHIVNVLANAQRQHQLALIFKKICSRPEQHIILAFSTGVLPRVAASVALDEAYLSDEEIRLFLMDKFQEIISTHRLRGYIPPQWPLPAVLNQLIKKSPGQFIYASTVICYVSSIRHKLVDRLNIVLGIRPSQKDLSFAELDALHIHILAGVEDVEPVLKILSHLFFGATFYPGSLDDLEQFLTLQPGDVELYLGDLSSLVSIGPNQKIKVLHASLQDFLVDPTCSKELWINPRCLQSLQLKGKKNCYSCYIPILISTKKMSKSCGSVFMTPHTISQMQRSYLS